MADTTVSPNMNLPIPTVSEDPGPDWANNVNACLTQIDSHNHSSGQGVPVGPNGMNINTDLSMNTNNLTDVRSTRFTAQLSPLSDASDLGCVYVSGVDLYYNDENANKIRLTASGSPAGGAGSITGLPSGTASASYAGGTFTFQQATNTPAAMALGPTKVAQAVASGKGVTLTASPSQVSDYDMILPPAAPTAGTGFVLMDSSGILSVTSLFFQAGYTPSFSSLTNISAINGVQFQYSRVGNAVTVWGNADVTFTAGSTLTSFVMTVPVNRTTNFDDNNVGGMVQSVDSGGQISMGIRGNGAVLNSVKAQGTTFSAETGVHNCRFHFTYMLG